MYNIEEITKSEGINYIRVDAYYDKHYSAIGFYEKCGFEPIAEKKNNFLQMVKRLSKDI